MSEPHLLPLDMALTRWSVMCCAWRDLASGHHPQLGPFLAGWFCRCMGASKPEDLGLFIDSFRVGWREADNQITIETRDSSEAGKEER